MEAEHLDPLARIERIEAAIAQLRFDIGVAERRSDGNSRRVGEAHDRLDNLSERAHRLEDLFEDGGAFTELERAVWRLAREVETLNQARTAGETEP